jgi:hypothetical protein
MKNRRGLMVCLILALALTLLMWGPGWAQNRGGGGPMQGQGNQLCTGGPGGTCVVNPATSPKTQNCPGYGAGAGQSQRQQGPKGPQGAGRGNQPNTQANPPVTSR